MSAAKREPGPWRIERNCKMQFCVVRDTDAGREFRLTPAGKPSSFKTWAGASRVARRLNREGAEDAALKAKYAGSEPLPARTLGAAIAAVWS